MPEKPSDEEIYNFLRNEYLVVGFDWRFFVGLRFAVLAFSATLLSALLGAYQYVLTTRNTLTEEQLIKLSNTAIWAIPVFGIASVLAIWIIEERTRTLYTACMQRAQMIEKVFKEKSGHFSLLSKTQYKFHILSHTWGIRLIYCGVLITWIFLFLESFYL
ncbi:MAG: hypothetical protein Q8Q23_03390 [bacterium]|nr:hypothetical protein [bacterium]